MIKINNLINEFIVKIKNIDFELYNESGLQHELGYYLRCNNIQTKFEYNTNIIFENPQEFLKKELDLYIKDKDGQYCIELKFPNKGACPRRMTQSIIDIFFLQQLINNGFKKGIFLFITKLPSFVNGRNKEDIYSYFRNSKPLYQFGCQDIPPFMLKKNNPAVQKLYSLLYSKKIELRKDYKIQFEKFDKNGHSYYYFLLTVKSVDQVT